ncbi:MAG: hypothetical protein OEZ34_01040 [Spirochaetia bacterium]|nr:hypothetical protein [Spirochaetia bacterium]
MGETTDKILKNSISELKYAFIATVTVLCLSFAIYSFLPAIRTFFSQKDSAISHERIYSSNAFGGEITYKLENNIDDSLKNKKINDLEQDLQILSRRFMRGQFELLSIPGSSDTIEVKKITLYKDQFEYKISKNLDTVTLKIISRNPAAVNALKSYLKLMETSWHPDL